MTFARKLKSERERLKLTQEQLASVLGVSVSWVEKAEREEREPHELMQEAALARLAALPE